MPLIQCKCCDQNTSLKYFPICENCFQSLIFCPPLCHLCGEIKCKNSLINIGDCQYPWKNKKFINFHASLYLAAGEGYTALKQWKFNNGYMLNKLILEKGKELILKRIQKTDFDCIIPIPQSSERIFQLKNSPPENIARALCEYLGIPILKILSKKRKSTSLQSSLPLEKRLSAENSFELKHSFRIKYKKILLVDDFYTSGKTLENASIIIGHQLNTQRIGVFTLGYRPYIRKNMTPIKFSSF